MSKDPQGPMENLLEGLEHHTKFLSDTELKAELQERGVDIDGFLQSANATIASYLKADRLAWMQIADEKKHRLETMRTDSESWLSKGEAAIREAWASLVKTDTSYAVAFRNKTDLTIQDMARILDDRQRLQSRNKGNE